MKNQATSSKRAQQQPLDEEDEGILEAALRGIVGPRFEVVRLDNLPLDRCLQKAELSASARLVVHAQLHRFKNGELHTSAGELVTDRKQAIAIALATAMRRRANRVEMLSSPRTGRDLDLAKAAGGAVSPPRGQLLLSIGGEASHVWEVLAWASKLLGLIVELCRRCGVRKRTLTRGSNADVTYAPRDSEQFCKTRPGCLDEVLQSRPSVRP